MKKFLALVLAVLMAFSLCSVAMAASDTPMTAAFLSELSKSKQFYAHVTGHTYENHSDSTNFDIYDDFNTNKISCNFKSKGGSHPCSATFPLRRQPSRFWAPPSLRWKRSRPC